MTSDSIGVTSLATPANIVGLLRATTTTTTTASSTAESSAAISPSEEVANAMETANGRLTARPKLGSRKSSGTMIVDGNGPLIVEDDLDDDDVRSMSPRKNSTELQKLSDDARRDLMEQAKILQTSLQAIVDRVETVREEHERLEGGNKFLQSYIGELMQTSRITSSAPLKSKGKTRTAK